MWLVAHAWPSPRTKARCPTLTPQQLSEVPLNRQAAFLWPASCSSSFLGDRLGDRLLAHVLAQAPALSTATHRGLALVLGLAFTP